MPAEYWRTCDHMLEPGGIHFTLLGGETYKGCKICLWMFVQATIKCRNFLNKITVLGNIRLAWMLFRPFFIHRVSLLGKECSFWTWSLQEHHYSQDNHANASLIVPTKFPWAPSKLHNVTHNHHKIPRCLFVQIFAAPMHSQPWIFPSLNDEASSLNGTTALR